MAHSFEASVVEVEMGQLDLVRVQTVGVNREAVVVRSDFDAAIASVLHGLIAAAMAEFQFEGLASERQAEQLVAQTDAEDRRGAEQPFDLADNIRQRGGIARAI